MDAPTLIEIALSIFGLTLSGAALDDDSDPNRSTKPMG
jgi:hypothetical protein